MTMNVTEFLDYIREAKSKSTFKNYKQGIKKFVEWYNKDANAILKERFEDLKSTEQTVRRRFNREIEKFRWLGGLRSLFSVMPNWKKVATLQPLFCLS